MTLVLKKQLQLVVKSLMMLFNRQYDYVDKKIASLLRTDEETIEMLIEADLLPAVSTPSGAVLTDENGNVILRY